MRQIILLGNQKTKRTIYLKKAADLMGVGIHLREWEDFGEEEAFGNFLKIDPPLWESCCLEELNSLTRDYKYRLTRLGEEQRVSFLNHPMDIQRLLDKRACKEGLKEAGLLVTEELAGFWQTAGDREAAETGEQFKPGNLWEIPFENGCLTERLLEIMKKNHEFQVFIKPTYGSGAAGVAAFRFQPATGRVVLYTCAAEDPLTHRLVNTKRLRRFTDRNQVFSLLERLLALDCVVERWYAKAEYQGFSYDLRAVVQDGQVDFLLARLSSGPITNLHLNNRPLKGSELELPAKVRDSIHELCCQAARCYPGLRSVGIDVLLEKGSLRPRIIEMNGQGDLIYQDIYDKNVIYRHQAEMMREWLWTNQN